MIESFVKTGRGRAGTLQSGRYHTDVVMGEPKAEGDVDPFGFDVAYEGFWDREGVGEECDRIVSRSIELEQAGPTRENVL